MSGGKKSLFDLQGSHRDKLGDSGRRRRSRKLFDAFVQDRRSSEAELSHELTEEGSLLRPAFDESQLRIRTHDPQRNGRRSAARAQVEPDERGVRYVRGGCQWLDEQAVQAVVAGRLQSKRRQVDPTIPMDQELIVRREMPQLGGCERNVCSRRSGRQTIAKFPGTHAVWIRPT